MPEFESQLLDEMKALQQRVGALRVEVQVNVEELARDNKTMLRNPYSVLYLPGLGWTAKNDLHTASWAQANVIRRDF